MTRTDAPETHDWRTCGCRECYIIRWEIWRDRGE